jgi:hypothetical protein
MNKDQRKGFPNHESLPHSFTHSCLGKIVIFVVILGALLFVAHITVPDRIEMIEETEDNIRQCILDNDSIQTDKIDDAINNIGYTFTHVDSTDVDADIWKAYRKYNRLEYHEHSFFATMHVHNNFCPQGKRVGIGIFGMVISTVNYNDFLLNVTPVHKGYGGKIIQTISDEPYYGESPDVKVYHYKGEEQD